MTLFIDNIYTAMYYNIIIHRGQSRLKSEEYTEKHHIIPKCIGGNNSNENIVILTGREHFLAHWLLTKMVHNEHQFSVSNALNRMLGQGRKERYRPHARLYAIMKETTKKNISGKNSPHYGVPKTNEHRENMSKAKMGKPSWNKGIPMREETKEKLREQDIGIHYGEKNGMYGKISPNRGKKLYHSSDKQIFVFHDDPILNDKNWKLGKLPK